MIDGNVKIHNIIYYYVQILCRDECWRTNIFLNLTIECVNRLDKRKVVIVRFIDSCACVIYVLCMWCIWCVCVILIICLMCRGSRVWRCVIITNKYNTMITTYIKIHSILLREQRDEEIVLMSHNLIVNFIRTYSYKMCTMLHAHRTMSTINNVLVSIYYSVIILMSARRPERWWTFASLRCSRCWSILQQLTRNTRRSSLFDVHTYLCFHLQTKIMWKQYDLINKKKKYCEN